MECKVSLGANKFVGIRDNFFVGKETVLAFESSEYALNELHATITDGTIAKRYVVKDRRFDISEYCTKACVLEVKVDLILNGTVAKTWLLEPFVVREAVGGYELVPEIALLREEIKTIKQAIKELNTKIYETM